MPLALASRTAGAMMSISSRPKLPLSPACGLSAATPMRGGEKPAAAMAACVSSSPLTMSGVESRPGDRGERHVARHARVPEPVEDIELARLAREADGVGDEGDLVVVVGLRQLHGALVERREGHGVGGAGLGQRQGGQEILLGVLAAGASNFAAARSRPGRGGRGRRAPAGPWLSGSGVSART